MDIISQCKQKHFFKSACYRVEFSNLRYTACSSMIKHQLVLCFHLLMIENTDSLFFRINEIDFLTQK